MLFGQIQQRFRELGVFGQKLSLELNGAEYFIICDHQAFLVYRINENCGMPPGVPGWPVCLVTNHTVVDESSPPYDEEDHFASGLSLSDWLEIIAHYCRRPTSETTAP